MIGYEIIFCADHSHDRDINDLRNMKQRLGRIVAVRPEQYVANVLSIEERSQLTAFFDDAMLQPVIR